jgi:hypothetical protein
MRNLYLLILLLLISIICTAQEAPFIKLEQASAEDMVMTDEEAMAGVMAGAGWSNEGLSYGLNLEMSMFGIITGIRGSISGGLFGTGEHHAAEMALLAGYGQTKGRVHTGFSFGVSRTSYRCMSPTSENCGRYEEGGFWGATGQLSFSVLLSDHTGIGLIGFSNLNKRSDLYGAMAGVYYRL